MAAENITARMMFVQQVFLSYNHDSSHGPRGWLVGWLISFASITVGLLCRMLTAFEVTVFPLIEAGSQIQAGSLIEAGGQTSYLF